MFINDVDAVGKIDVVPTILDTICRLTGMGFAAVARVTDDRWIACSVRDEIDFGLVPGGELRLETTICHEIRQSGMPVVIADVATDAVFHTHPTPTMYGFRSYISVPINLPGGAFFGTLCAIDPQPRDLERPEVQQAFRMFADLIGFHLDAAEKLVRSDRLLASEIQTGELREQFIAVLGHDLRNPLASVQAGVTLLNKTTLVRESTIILGHMQSSIDRMARMIDDILDFARGRLGGGLSLNRRLVNISALVQQIVDELAPVYPERSIILRGCSKELLVDCDPQRIGQLLSNLLGNALTHGATDQTIKVEVSVSNGELLLSVANGGAEIPETLHETLFHPFVRGTGGRDRGGLGLGLFIASEIASAHGGGIALVSSTDETRFVVSIPAAA